MEGEILNSMRALYRISSKISDEKTKSMESVPSKSVQLSFEELVEQQLVGGKQGNLTAPEQLNIFMLIEPDRAEYSNILDFYHSIPKGVYAKRVKTFRESDADADRKRNRFLSIDREFTYENPVTKEKNVYQMRLTPAVIGNGSNKRHIYYGEREDLFERAIIKLASEKEITTEVTSDHLVKVTGSYQSLRKHLAKHGHTYSTQETVEAIKVLGGSILTITGETVINGKSVTVDVSDSILTGLKSVQRTDKQVVGYFSATLHPLISSAILSKGYRQQNHTTRLTLKPLSAWLLDLFTLRWKQASTEDSYHFRTSFIQRNSPFGYSQENTLRPIKSVALDVERALRDMVYDEIRNPRGVLSHFAREGEIRHFNEETQKWEGVSKRSKDPLFEVWPSQIFVKEQRRANKLKKVLLQEETVESNTRRVKQLMGETQRVLG